MAGSIGVNDGVFRRLDSNDYLVKMKRCRYCDIEKPSTDFYTNSKGVVRNRCKDCYRRIERRNKQQNIELMRDRFKAWREQKRGLCLTGVAKNRAQRRGLAFDLDPDDIQARIDSGVCELTGIAFDLTQPRSWNAPSLDRIDSTKGYTRDNVRVVLYSLNVMANTWGLQTILEVASALISPRASQASTTPSARVFLRTGMVCR